MGHLRVAQTFLKFSLVSPVIVCYSINQREGKGSTQGVREHEMTTEQTNEIKAMHEQAQKSFDRANSDQKRDVYRAELIAIEKVMEVLGIEW